ncbi:MAG: regulatory signaling modulator protein AmpE [Halobacteria archaeon]|nr:regulatory signaling modulator protein AmpE [Halobacteria archaeon]
MNLISILIALAVETFYRPIQELRRFNWFTRYSDTLYNRLEGQGWRDGPLGVILVVGSVVFGVWLLDAMLAGVAAVFSFLFGLAVLIYTLGPRDLAEEVKEYSEAVERGDYEAGEIIATRIVGYDISGSPIEATRHVMEGILVQSNVRLFGVLLWFMLLGPVGAILFRLSCELKSYSTDNESGYAAAGRDLYRIMIWLPTHLVVLGFALAGSFMDTVSLWKSYTEIWKTDSEALLIESGIGAISHEPHDEEGTPDLEGVSQAMALVKRTLLVWLAALALLTLTGWVF